MPVEMVKSLPVFLLETTLLLGFYFVEIANCIYLRLSAIGCGYNTIKECNNRHLTTLGQNNDRRR